MAQVEFHFRGVEEPISRVWLKDWASVNLAENRSAWVEHAWARAWAARALHAGRALPGEMPSLSGPLTLLLFS